VSKYLSTRISLALLLGYGTLLPNISSAVPACYTNINLAGDPVAAADAAACTLAGEAANATYYWADPYAGAEEGINAENATAWTGEDLEFQTQALEIEMPQRLILTDNQVDAPNVAFDGLPKDIARWQVWSNGSFTAKLLSTFPPDANGNPQTAEQLGYTPPDYPAFTKQDLNAAGIGIADSFDELPATFSIVFSNIESIATVGAEGAKTMVGADSVIFDMATAGQATWGPKEGNLMGAEMGGGINVQVMDEAPEGGLWEPPEIAMQVTIPEMNNAWNVQPGTYQAAIQLTVIATQPTVTQVAAIGGNL